MRRYGAFCLALGFMAGCTGSTRAGAPQTRRVGMSLEESRQVVQALEQAQLKRSQDDPLRHPQSVEDLLSILKRDQMDLFPAGVEFAAQSTDPTAKALHAQIELAWGEAQLMLGQLFGDSASRLKPLLTRLKSKSVAQADMARIEETEKTIKQCETLAEALDTLAAEHVALGARLSQEVMAANPNDYMGYRVAADYHRLRGDWVEFGRMLKKIEEANPDSNGLIFQKGMAALQRDKKPAVGTPLLRKALENDPAFTRAQAQLVMTRASAVEAYQELERLRAMSPNHQIVVWAGPAITKAYDLQMAENARK